MIFDRPVLRFSEIVWFGMPIYFAMPFLPRFRHTELFQYDDCALGCEPRVWFDRSDISGMPNQGLSVDFGLGLVNRIISVC